MMSPGGAIHMSHSYSQDYQHIVFSTKERQKLISKSMQPKLWSYMAGIGRNHGFLVHANGGMEDHVHLLVQVPARIAAAEVVSVIKSNSSRWLNEHEMKFAWQEGYGAFSVSKSNLSTVTRYIADQERHHRKMTFEEEFIGFLEKLGIEYDPKHVFG
jgi:REP element-mobilizing transposase RayT